VTSAPVADLGAQRVQKRWFRIVVAAAVAVIGVGVLAVRFGGWFVVGDLALQIAGLLVTIAIALIAGFRRTRRRWPAAIALLGTAPMAELVIGRDALPALLEIGGSIAMLVFGVVGTVIAALIVMLAPPVQAPADPVARAVAQRRSSE
jgi:hypothetical protein